MGREKRWGEMKWRKRERKTEGEKVDYVHE
jgi:hypothetical protein